MGFDGEGLGKGIDCLGADSVESDTELKHLVVVFGTRIDGGDTIDDFA